MDNAMFAHNGPYGTLLIGLTGSKWLNRGKHWGQSVITMISFVTGQRPSRHPADKISTHWRKYKALAWHLPFFIHHRTPDGTGVVLFTPTLRRQYPSTGKSTMKWREVSKKEAFWNGKRKCTHTWTGWRCHRNQFAYVCLMQRTRASFQQAPRE